MVLAYVMIVGEVEVYYPRPTRARKTVFVKCIFDTARLLYNVVESSRSRFLMMRTLSWSVDSVLFISHLVSQV